MKTVVLAILTIGAALAAPGCGGARHASREVTAPVEAGDEATWSAPDDPPPEEDEDD